MPFIKKRYMIGAKFETTSGTENAPGATDINLVAQEVSFKTEPTLIPRNIIGPSFARKNARTTNKLARITFKTELVGVNGADPGVAPVWTKLLKACGMKETLVASTSAQYDPVVPTTVAYDATGANGNVALTIYAYLDGVVKKARGCRGTVRLVGESGGLAMMEWEFLGAYVGVANNTYPTLHSSYDAKIPPLVEQASFAMQGITAGVAIIKSFTIDLGNTTVPRWDASSVTGIKEILITDRECVGTIDPEEDTETILTKAWEDRLMDADGSTGTTGNFSLTVGTTSGNKFEITCPAARMQITDVSEGDRDNLAVSNVNLGFFVPEVEDANDKEIRIKQV